ncbi:MAG: domain S-box protein [Acidobacteriales bacterium]|nr:domain S-box protein [Terriglobales bacterium]
MNLGFSQLGDGERQPPTPISAVVFDRQVLLETVGYDNGLLRGLVLLFQEDAPLRVAELGTTLKRVWSASLATTAYALKGMVSNFASGPAYKTASTLECMGRSCEWTNAGFLIAELNLQIQQLNTDLNELLEETSSL